MNPVKNIEIKKCDAVRSNGIGWDGRVGWDRKDSTLIKSHLINNPNETVSLRTH